MGQFIRLPSGRHVLDTGKVRIGLLAKPPVRDMGSQAELIQSALLDRPTHKGWPHTRSHVKGASGAMDLRRLADAPTLKVRDAYDEAHEPVIYLNNSMCARFMRAVDRLIARVWR